MKLVPPKKLKEIAELIGAKYIGDPNILITGLNEIHKVESGDIVFVDKPKYYDKALGSAASVILMDREVDCPDGKALLVSNDPFRDFNKIIGMFVSSKKTTSMISDDAVIGKDTVIQPGVFIGDEVEIGDNCIIHSGAVIYGSTSIGDNVIVHANTVIGSDAFYYKKRDEGHDKFISCGRVIIENNVEIGASSTIDRGVTGYTWIKEGTKIDNLVQIGHDTIIGRNCLLAAQVGIAGATVIEDDVILWGQVGVPSDVTIGKGAVVLAQSGITKSLEGDRVYFGSPAGENREKLKELAMIRKIPVIIEKLNDHLE